MIDAVATKVSLARRCELMQVTRSTHYRWLRRRDRVREQTGLERKLLMWMRCLHDRWHGLLGYRRMHAMLETEGFDAPLRLVRRLMKDNEMSGRPSGRRSRYKGKARRPAAADLLRRDFTADAPNCRWVSDLSEFETAEGKLHLGMVKDLYDGTIVGHKMGDRQTAKLVVQALSLAWRVRLGSPRQLILHSDRGSQYTSRKLAQWLKAHDVEPSMGRVGDCADNASAESFFGVIKRDIRHVVRDVDKADAKAMIDDYIVNLHNPLRRRAIQRRVHKPTRRLGRGVTGGELFEHLILSQKLDSDLSH